MLPASFSLLQSIRRKLPAVGSVGGERIMYVIFG